MVLDLRRCTAVLRQLLVRQLRRELQRRRSGIGQPSKLRGHLGDGRVLRALVGVAHFLAQRDRWLPVTVVSLS